MKSDFWVKLILKVLASIDWIAVFKKVWEYILPELERRVKDSRSKMDDKALDACKLLANKFLGA